MKRIIFSALTMSVMLLTYCGSHKKAQTAVVEPLKMTYTKDVQPLIDLNCSPCHIPPKGNKKPYVTYAAAKEDIDDILRRIQLNPTDRGFMPMRHPKMSDSVIHVFVQWKTDGLLEK